MALWEREKLFFFEAVTAAVACKGLRTKNSSRQRQRQEGEREKRQEINGFSGKGVRGEGTSSVERLERSLVDGILRVGQFNRPSSRSSCCGVPSV
jgi:hypothetical protein